MSATSSVLNASSLLVLAVSANHTNSPLAIWSIAFL